MEWAAMDLAEVEKLPMAVLFVRKAQRKVEAYDLAFKS
jgi:hypothetical protein